MNGRLAKSICPPHPDSCPAATIAEEHPKITEQMLTNLKTNDANNLNIGFGDGDNVNPSLLFVLSNKETYFVKWDKDVWDRKTPTLTNPLDTIKSNSRYTVTIERKQNIIQVFLNGSKLLENVRIPPELRNMKRLYFATNTSIENSNGNARGTTIIENISIEDID